MKQSNRWISFLLVVCLFLAVVPKAFAVEDRAMGRAGIETEQQNYPVTPQDRTDPPTAFGIDVSHHQGTIDWDTVAPQIDFAIIRCGYGDDETTQDDWQWHRNVQECTRLGIPFGVYIYSYAWTEAEAVSEANHVLRLLEGYQPTLPVYYDLEDESILEHCSTTEILNIARTFCEKIEAAGYRAGVYANYNWWTNYLTSAEYERWDRWIARYAGATGYSKDYTMWQYSEKGRINGISVNVDMNHWYGPFPPEECVVQWKGGGTSLNGTVDLSVLAVLSENLVNDPSTVVRFSYAGKTVDVPMADARPEMKDGEQRYRFYINMYAKQMADRVTFQVYTDKGPIGEARSYSIQEYCTNMIGKTTDPEMLTMYKALLNYGAAAQMRFGYNTDNLANASLSEADKKLPENVDVSAFQRTLTGSEPGIRAKGGTLVLDETVIIRVNYELEEGRDISDYTFTIDGEEVQPKHMGGNIWCVETEGIPAKELDQMHTFTCGGITAKYGALSYVLSKLTSTDPLDVNMVKALYAYWAAAKAVLG